MTAEIAILNTTAVALASDSAVTANTSDGHKIYNTAQKLFRLSNSHPVGAMIFGNATFMGVPWETIVKEYRNQLGNKNFDTLDSYSSDFMQFLCNNDNLFPETRQKTALEIMTFSYFTYIKERINNKIKEKLEKKIKLTGRLISQTASDVIKNRLNDLEGRKWIENISEVFMEGLKRDYASMHDSLIDKIFEKLPIYKKDKIILKRIAGLVFCKDIYPASTTGLVIAGFGEKDIFPKLQAFQIEAIVKNQLKYTVTNSTKISYSQNASIIPFAQQEMVHTFISGIDPGIRSNQEEYLKNIFKKYPDIFIESLNKISDKEKLKLKEKLNNASNSLYENYLNDIENFIQENYIRPVISIVNFLPKDELAVMAETLVNLTSFKRKVSIGSETVGGPIDVAVISKGDGFVWIRRKNYFDINLNPHYHLTHK